MNEDEFDELLGLMKKPSPVPEAFIENLWDDLSDQLVEPLPSSPDALDQPETDTSTRATFEHALVGVATGSDARRPTVRSALSLASAAALIVLVGIAFSIWGDSAPNSLETEDSPAIPTQTTSDPGTSSTSTPDGEVPPQFVAPVQVGRIERTRVGLTFTSVADTAYVVVVRDDKSIVDTISGSATAGEAVPVAVEGLSPGTAYTIRVTLIGPPTATSDSIQIRTPGGSATSGGSTPAVEIVDLRLTQVSPTQFQVNYETNVCANGTFVLFDADGIEIGRNEGQPEGCTTQHLGIPGTWTEPLNPDTPYVITITVEADGAGLGNGNTATESLAVATAPLADQPVQFVDLRVIEVSETHFQIEYESNVCANGSFVVTRNGEEVGRNEGLPTGCGTEHLAAPGMWTPELRPDTTYVITIGLEANGAGLGGGNTTTESREITTAAAEPAPQ